MKYRVPLLAAAVAGMLALSAGPALATTTLDQHQTDVSGYADAWQISNMRLAQTFTTGMAGSLSRVDINADAFGGSVTFEILGATYLDTQTVNLNDSGWTQINLKTPFNVVKGTYYYLIVVPNGKISWRGVCTNPYSGGKAYVLDGSWSTIPAWATAHHATLGYCEQDFAFRTYVTTATLATPKPTKAPTAKTGKTAAAVSTSGAVSTPTATPPSTSGASDTPAASPAATDTPAPTDSPAATNVVAAATAVSAATDPGSGSASGSSGSGGSAVPIVAALGAALLVVGGGFWFLVARRRKA